MKDQHTSLDGQSLHSHLHLQYAGKLHNHYLDVKLLGVG